MASVQQIEDYIKSKNITIRGLNPKLKLPELVIEVPNSERIRTSQTLSKELQRKFNTPFIPDRSGKIFRAFPKKDNDPLTGFRVSVKPEASLKPQADDHESLSTYCIRAAVGKVKDFSLDTLKKNSSNVSAVRLIDAYNKCDSSWRASSARHGRYIANEFSKLNTNSYKYLQRGGTNPWIKNLYNRFKVLKRELGVNLNDDKWDPADMWIVHNKHINVNFKDFLTLKDLNAFLVEGYVNQEIIGVSLKKCDNDRVKGSVKNVRREPREVTDVKTDYGKVFTKFTTVNFKLKLGSGTSKNYSMAIRPFTNEESSGELKGVGSLAGKVGITEINRLFKEIYGKEVERKPELVPLFQNNKDEFYKRFFNRYKNNIRESGINNPIDLRRNVEMKIADDIYNYYMGKFQAVTIVNFLDKMTDEQKNRSMLGMYAYASSTTELSGPFIKVSN